MPLAVRKSKETWKSLCTKSPDVAKVELAKIEAKMARTAVPMETGKAPTLSQFIHPCLT